MALTKISTGGVKDDSVTSAKIPNAAIGNTEIAQDSVDAGQLKTNNTGSNGQFLKQLAGGTGGLAWDDAASEGTDIKSTGESGTTKFLRVDGDGTCSWQVPPTISFANDANNRVVTGTGSGLNGEANLTFDGTDLVANGSGDVAIRLANGGTNKWSIFNSSGGGHQLQIFDNNGSGTAAAFNTNGSVDLYHDNSKKLETTSSGINVTGQINVNGSALSAAPEITATVDGSLSADDAVIVKSTGNIEKVTKTITIANPITHSSVRQISNNRFDHKLAYDKLTGYVACACRNGNLSNRGQLTFHKLDDSSYQPTAESGGNIYAFNSSNVYFPRIAANGKGQFLIVYKDVGDNRIACAAWSVNSSGVGTQGQAKWVSASGESTSTCDVCYSPDDDLFVIVYREGSVTKSRTLSMTAGNNTTLNTVSSNLFSYYINDGNKVLYYDEYSNKIIHAGWNSSYVRAISGTISGTNISWNSAVNIAGNGSYQGEYFAFGGDPKTGLMFAAWRGASSQSDYGQALGFKVNGNGFTAGSETQHRNADTLANGVGYNGATDQIVLSYGGGGSWGTKTVAVNSSTLALTFGNAEEISGASPQYSPISAVYMADQGRMMISSAAPSSQNYQTNLVSAYYGAGTTNMTATNFIGFSSAAYSNGNTGTVKVTGNTSTHSSLTAGQKYYVQIDGTLGTAADSPSVEAGTALSSTKLLIKG